MVNRLSTIFYAVALILVTAVLCARPNYDWDLLPYSALALAVDIHDPDSVHARAYAEARRALPPAKYALLVDSINPYRRQASEDPAFFSRELSFYSVKPLYVAAIYGFYRAGVPLPRATVLPSLISFVVLGVLLLIWTRKYIAEPYAAALSLVMLLTPFVELNARASTPDLLTALLLLLGAFGILEGRSRTAALTIMALAVLVRVDAVLFVVVMGVFVARAGLLSRHRAALVVSGAVLATIIVLLRHGEVLREFFLVRTAPARLAGAGAGPFLTEYARGIRLGLPRIQFSAIALVTCVAVITLYIRRRLVPGLRRDSTAMLVGLIFAHIAIRFALHPTFDDRFLIADYLLLWILFLSTVRAVSGIEQAPAYNRLDGD